MSDAPRYEPDWVAIRRRIKAAREARGWTQRELGEHVGLSGTRIGQIESSIAASEAVLARIAEALGRSVVWLRYGVTEGLDADAIRAEGERAGRAAALREVYAQLLRSGFEGVPVPSMPRQPATFRRTDRGAPPEEAAS